MRKIVLSVFAVFALAVQAQKPLYLDEKAPIEQRVEDALKRMTLQEKIRVVHAQSKFSAPGIPRLGFPDLWTDDGPHGVRPDVLWDEWRQAGQTNDSCVAFPALTCLAATWNPDMARIYGNALAEEALYRNKAVMLGPGVNINRSPLNGRNFEYMGEDPFLASRIVVPYVQGLQANGVAACVKHYALNNDEEYRHQVNVQVSDRALHEIYLPAFKAAVTEGKAWTIMGAYNLYKGQHNCHNEYLINKVLKTDWKFDGVVISDWGGAHDSDEAIRNGLDLEMGTWTDGLTMGATNAYDNYHLADVYLKGILAGKYTTKELDEKVRRLLRLYFRTTMNHNRPYGSMCSEAHYATAKQIAEEGIVLLKNTNAVLPLNLNTAKNVLVVGENAIKMMTVGGGSSSLKVQREVSPLQGIRDRLASTGVNVDYARGYVGDTGGEFDGVTSGQNLKDTRSEAELIAEAVEKAKSADYVIVFGGLNKADFQDSEGHDRQSYDLPYAQNALVSELAKVNKNLVFVNISGNASALPWLNDVPAVMQAWFLGSEAGNAIASVLVGDANPSGKLPYTWAAKLDDTGAHALNTYPGTWREGHEIIDEEYKEDIYVGYRWFDKQNTKTPVLKSKKGIKPIFAFGHGLSYTTFALGKANVTADGENWKVTVNVTNTGKVAGAEVVQLYISDVKSSLPRPVKELKGFKKVFLMPGQSKDVTITFGRDALSFYDDAKQAWVCEPGDFEALVGTSSDNISSKIKFCVQN